MGMAKSTNPCRYFDSSPEVIRLVVMMYVRYHSIADIVRQLKSEGFTTVEHALIGQALREELSKICATAGSQRPA